MQIPWRGSESLHLPRKDAPGDERKQSSIPVAAHIPRNAEQRAVQVVQRPPASNRTSMAHH
jgi:hypothetical protein